MMASSVYESDPVGPGTGAYLNAAVAIHTNLYPIQLFRVLKDYEIQMGRDPDAARWTDRIIDLDIIAWGQRSFSKEGIIIPHASYRDRLFVLLPLKELRPDWVDPKTKQTIEKILLSAMPLKIAKTDDPLLIDESL
jgi:2-amino-4-hydroxy-6-hydroxymethyldihydropteridine diphosphokinase